MRARIRSAVVVAAVLALSAPAFAATLTNGDFEAGLFGWTVVDQAGGSGSWFADTPGSTTPLSGLATSAAGGSPHGALYAVSDQTGPGSHALLQTFTIAPGGGSLFLVWDMFINDASGAGPLGTGLDFTAGATQVGRVDILSAAATAFDVGAGVALNCFIGATSSVAGPNPFATHICDLSGLAAGSYQLRFAETDNQFFFNMGIDNVRFVSRGVPEPASLALLGIALAGMGFARRRA